MALRQLLPLSHRNGPRWLLAASEVGHALKGSQGWWGGKESRRELMMDLRGAKPQRTQMRAAQYGTSRACKLLSPGGTAWGRSIHMYLYRLTATREYGHNKNRLLFKKKKKRADKQKMSRNYKWLQNRQVQAFLLRQLSHCSGAGLIPGPVQWIKGSSWAAVAQI